MGREARVRREREVKFDDGSVVSIHADAADLKQEANLQQRAANINLILPRGIQKTGD